MYIMSSLYTYITDVPYESFSEDSVARNIEEVKHHLKDIFITNNGKFSINYNDDKWDFNPIFKENRDENILSFPTTKYHPKLYNKIPSKYFKLYAVHEIYHAIGMCTIKGRLTTIYSIFNQLFDIKPYLTIDTITNEDIAKIIEMRCIKKRTHAQYYRTLHTFFDFVQNNFNEELLVKQAEFVYEYEGADDYNTVMEGKIKTIPHDLFTIIINKLEYIINSDEATHNEKTVAAALLILSQTGIRISDILMLKTHNFKPISFNDDKGKTYYLEYESLKPSKNHLEPLKFFTFCTDIVCKTYEFLISTRFKIEDHLITLENARGFAKHPISKRLFQLKVNELFLKYLRFETSREWEGLTKNHVGNGVYLSIPSFHQYRVYFSTYLYHLGYSSYMIARCLGHLSGHYRDYYSRNLYSSNYEKLEIKHILDGIHKGTLKPIGNKKISDEVVSIIKDFMNKNNYNIETDYNAIKEKISSTMSIKIKSHGICFKTPYAPCVKDNITDEILCAFNSCPNNFTFFYNVDITLKKFNDLLENYKILLNNGKKRAAEHELNLLKNLARTKLIPELQELEDVIRRKGSATVLKTYKHLSDIVSSYKEILKDVKWQLSSL